MTPGTDPGVCKIKNLCNKYTCVYIYVIYKPGRLDLEVVEDFGVEKREDDHLLQSWDVTPQTSDAVKAHLRRRGEEGWWRRGAESRNHFHSSTHGRHNSPIGRWPSDRCPPVRLLRSSSLCESPEDLRVDDSWQTNTNTRRSKTSTETFNQHRRSLMNVDHMLLVVFGQSQASCFPLFPVFLLS